MRASRAGFLFAALAVSLCGGVPRQTFAAAMETPVGTALQKYVDSGELPGAVSILYRDGVRVCETIGFADVATKRKITADDLFMQCSQTKGFCGVTVAKLVEEGKLSLEDPVSKYFPEFKRLTVRTEETNGTYRVVPARNVLTVRMVMNHTGGFQFELPNGQEMGGWNRRMPLRSVAAVAAATPLDFEPGTKVRYSNTGIDIGAAVVEAVTGKRWEDYLKESFFDPLGMTSSGFRPTDAQLATRLQLYYTSVGKPAVRSAYHKWMQPPFGDDRVFPSAGAGLWTTANDQYRFYKMLMNLGVGDNGVRVLKEETVRNLLAVSQRSPELTAADCGYSLGLCSMDKDGWFGHGGAWGTECMVNPEKRQLKLWVVQRIGKEPWREDLKAAVDGFLSGTSVPDGASRPDGQNLHSSLEAAPASAPADVPAKRLCAHRGFSAVAPENSLPAYGAAVALGASEIEFDIWWTKDGEIVSIHDGTIDRISDGSGMVTEKTLDELLRYDFGEKTNPHFKGLRILTFKEILARFARKTVFNIHVKMNPGSGKLQELVRLIRDAGVARHCYFMTADDGLQSELAALAPDIPRVLGYRKGRENRKHVDDALRLNCWGLQLFKPHFDADTVAYAHEKGLHVNCFYSDDPLEAKKFLEWGVDTLLTNDYQPISTVTGLK